jgi:hypothetical protein
VSLAIAAGGFWLGRIRTPASPPAAVELRRSEVPGWVEVWREGELDSEWQAKDGAVYEVIDPGVGDRPAGVGPGGARVPPGRTGHFDLTG